MAEALERLYYNLIQRLKRENRNLRLLASGLAAVSGAFLIAFAVKIRKHR